MSTGWYSRRLTPVVHAPHTRRRACIVAGFVTLKCSKTHVQRFVQCVILCSQVTAVSLWQNAACEHDITCCNMLAYLCPQVMLLVIVNRLKTNIVVVTRECALKGRNRFVKPVLNRFWIFWICTIDLTNLKPVWRIQANRVTDGLLERTKMADMKRNKFVYVFMWISAVIPVIMKVLHFTYLYYI